MLRLNVKLSEVLLLRFRATFHTLPLFLCVSVFQGSLLVIVIMIDGSEKRNCEGGFEL